MDTVTYPCVTVANLLARDFDLRKIDVSAPASDERDVLREVKPLWAPLFVARNHGGTELRRWAGWMSAADFVAELTFVLGMDELLRRRVEKAYARFREACDTTPHASVAPEALFWAGAAAFKRGGNDFAALHAVWAELRDRYPSSTWSRRADVFDQANNGFT